MPSPAGGIVPFFGNIPSERIIAPETGNHSFAAGSLPMKDKKTSASPRRRFSVRKALMILLLVLLIFSLTSMALSAVMYRVLFPRRSGVSEFRYAYAELGADAPPRELFRFPSGDNQLTGYRYDAPDPKGLIVVVNGIGAGVDSHLPEIQYFTAHGYSAVVWDNTGIGDSEGRWSVGMQQIKLDLLAYLDWQEAETPDSALPVLLYGHSAGGYAACTALATDHRIDGVICISAFESPIDIMLYHARNRVGFLADTQVPFLRLENWFLFGADADCSAFASINGADVPVLIIQGNSDDLVPRSEGLLRFEDQYTNPRVRCVEIATEYRNEHSTPWLSEASACYEYTFPKDETPDKAQANELSETFMADLLEFLDEAAAS